MYACPEGLDPKGSTLIEKKNVLSRKEKWEGLPVKPHPMNEFRKVSTKSLMQRLDVTQFKDEAPLTDLKINPQKVRIPLKQHIGTSAEPVVKQGQIVKKYELIARGSGNVSANIHASIDGRVVEINDNEIIIERV